MWAMAQNSIALFFRGKLFAEPAKAFLMILIGVLVTASLLVLIARLGAPLWMAAVIAALIGGAFQPYLFRNLRYR
jgi:Na+-transporting NADH:ubiquinone oxidoreductase subunit NqrB